MARTPDGTEARNCYLNVRVTERGLDKVDEYRGAWTRSEYMRQAIAYAIKNGMKGPDPVEW